MMEGINIPLPPSKIKGKKEKRKKALYVVPFFSNPDIHRGS